MKRYAELMKKRIIRSKDKKLYDNRIAKLTKSNTVSFRGNKNTTLKIYGNLFKLEPFKDGMFKLVKVEEENESTEIEQNELDNLNSSEIDEEINNLIDNSEDDDALPF